MQEQLEERTEASGPQPSETKPPSTKQRELSNERARVWSEERPWPVKILTWLLALEGVLLGLMGFFNLQGGGSVMDRLADRPFFASVVPLSLLALIAVIGFVQLRPGAWVVAMLLQGMLLLMALIAYFSSAEDEPMLYVMLLYGVVMVLYLNYAEVPLVFRVQPGEAPVEEQAGEPPT